MHPSEPLSQLALLFYKGYNEVGVQIAYSCKLLAADAASRKTADTTTLLGQYDMIHAQRLSDMTWIEENVCAQLYCC